MTTRKQVLAKGLRRLVYTLLLMVTAPIVIYEAFKNEGHPMYIPVLVVGLILALTAIGMGFYGVKTLVDGLFLKEDDADTDQGAS